jgi:hypothetical protein
MFLITAIFTLVLLSACSSTLSSSDGNRGNQKNIVKYEYNPSESLSEDEIVAEIESIKKQNQ